jgi:glycosyltransferase involved in cell wall biosynthesis
MGMIIGVDATSWQNNRGFGRYARSLLTTLTKLDQDNRYVFLLDSTEQTDAISDRVEKRFVQASMPTTQAASATSRRSIGDMWRMSRALGDPKFDLLFYPTIYSYVPVISRARKLVIIYDVIADKYPSLTFSKLSSRLFWKTKVALGLRQAQAILTISDYSRDRIAEHFKLDPDRIQVIGTAGDTVFRVIRDPVLSPQSTPFLSALNLPLDYPLVIYVGGFGPHKNLDNMIDVFGKLVAQPAHSDTRLVMVGEYQKEVFYSEYHHLATRIDELGLNGRVIFTGYLPDDELVVLLNLSTLLVLPSYMEGFGLPAVEAAACGCPVIATKESPLPSLMGDACIYIDPYQPSELLEAFNEVLGSESKQQEMRSAGIAAAAGLTWDAAARQLLNIING